MSGPYMLGTDTCAFILHRSSPTLLQRIQQVPLQAQVMSVVTLAELQYGVQLSSRKKANRTAVDALVRHLTVIDWSREAALTHLAGELHRSARGMARPEVAYRDVLLEMSLS
jgi:tRNA(fMet)-specific endonuclease VapC